MTVREAAMSRRRGALICYDRRMRVATLRDGTRDGRLIVVDETGTHYASAAHVAPTLQVALEDWNRTAPLLNALATDLEAGRARGESLGEREVGAPLPRAFEWIDGSAYLNHIRLVRKARGVEPPEGLETDPLVYQGGSGVFLGPTDPLVLPDPGWGLDFESEVCVVVGDVPRGTTADRAGDYIRLIMLANDVTYRNLVPAELAKGFGFVISKPATAFSPLAVTPDVLGEGFRDGRVHVRLCSTYNNVGIGNTDTGPEMHFSFFELIAHVAQTRALTAGTIIGSGTVSNRDRARGVSCLVEQRMIETIERGGPVTPYMKVGDTIRIEGFMNDADGAETGTSPFGAINQQVVAPR